MKKGFTLVEIMASIIILSVVMMIGVGVYNQVNDKIRQKQYENKIVYIENQAALYGSETGYIETTVQQLVDAGYVEADEGKRVTDPRHPKDPKYDLNPYVVEIRREGESYYGQLINVTVEKDSDGNYIYNTDSLDQTNKNLNIIVKIQNSNIILEENDWTNKNVTLSYEIKGDKKGENPTSVTWFDNVNSFQGIKEDSIEVSASQYLNTEYRVEVIFSDGTKYEAKRTVKIDKQAPVVYEKSIKIEKEDEWTNSDKKVTILASDQNGSGIAGYAVVEQDSYTKCKDLANNQWINPNRENPEVYETSLGAGTHYICVKDQAGNYNDENIDISPEDPPLPQVVVDKIDTTPPDCNITVNGTTALARHKTNSTLYPLGMTEAEAETWYVSDVTFDVTPINEECGSPLVQVIKPNVTITSNITKGSIKAKVIDAAGNVGECSNNEDIKIDKTAPVCKLGGDAPVVENSGTRQWNNRRTITISCSDSESKCVKEGVVATKTYVNQYQYEAQADKTNLIEVSNGTLLTTVQNPFSNQKIYDKVGNSTTCSDTAQVYIDAKAPAVNRIEAKKWNGNSYNDDYDGGWTNKSVKLTASAIDDGGIGVVDSTTWEYQYRDKNDLTKIENGTSNILKCNSDSKCEEGQYKVYYKVCDTLNNCSVYNDITGYTSVNIDRTDPECVNPYENAQKYGYVKNGDWMSPVGWSKSSQKIYVGCEDQDGLSGCKNGATEFSHTFSSEAKEGKIEISDNAGNTRECPVDVKIDKTPPNITCKPYKTGVFIDTMCGKGYYTENGGSLVYCTFTDEGGSGLGKREGAYIYDANNNVMEWRPCSEDIVSWGSDDELCVQDITSSRVEIINICDKARNCRSYTGYVSSDAGKMINETRRTTSVNSNSCS